MRRLLAASFALLLLGAGLMTLAVTVGRALPMPERLTRWHFDACSLPCWNGITPGVTLFDEARDRVHSLTASVVQPITFSEMIPGQGQLVSWAKANTVTDNYWVLTLETNNGLVPKVNVQTNFPDRSPDSLMPRLGEVVLLLGPPTCVHANAYLSTFSLLYVTDRGSVLIMVDSLNWWTPVWFFIMDSRTSSTCTTIAAAPWRGNAPQQYRRP